MKKILYSIFIISFSLFLLGCGKEMTAREAVSNYLENYITLDSSVTEQLDNFVKEENDLNDSQKEVYKDILKKEYSSLTFDIENERYEGDTAYLKVKINVINLYKAQQEALDYYNENSNEFNNEEGNYDKSKFMDYRLEKMKEANETINYDIEFKLIKTDDKWQVTQLSNDDLKKIHGIYNEE